MRSLLIAFVISIVASGLIVRIASTRTMLWDDGDVDGVQKLHAWH